MPRGENRGVENMKHVQYEFEMCRAEEHENETR